VKSAAWPAGGAATGAAAGSALGPVGTLGGAAIGAVVGHSLDENAQLRSGELTGGGALDKEVERWKTRALQASALEETASKARDWLEKALTLAVAIGTLWFLWRNRANFKNRGILGGLAHALVGSPLKGPP
jgi:hypothetical protein